MTGEAMIGREHEVRAVLSKGRSWARRRIKRRLIDIASAHGLLLGQISFEDGIDQDHGPVMIGTATCVGVVVKPRVTDDLDPVDLVRLREITRNAHAQECPRGPRLTDSQADDVINEIAPQTIEHILRQAVNGGAVL